LAVGTCGRLPRATRPGPRQSRSSAHITHGVFCCELVAELLRPESDDWAPACFARSVARISRTPSEKEYVSSYGCAQASNAVGNCARNDSGEVQGE